MSAEIVSNWTSIDAHVDGLAAAPTIVGKELTGMFEVVFEGTRAQAHVEDGFLKASGRAISGTEGEEWRAEMSFARDPGIFELARGGEHYFFDGVGESLELLGTMMIRDGLEHA